MISMSFDVNVDACEIVNKLFMISSSSVFQSKTLKLQQWKNKRQNILQIHLLIHFHNGYYLPW